MISVIQEKKALDFVSRYYDLLSKTGYSKHGLTRWYLIYLFLVDFYNWIYPYVTDADYKTLDMAMVKLFSGGNCLVPYQVLGTDKLKIGRHVGFAHYTGPSVLRKTQPTAIMRTTESDKLRRKG